MAGAEREGAMVAEDKTPEEGVDQGVEGAAVTQPLNRAATTTVLVTTRVEMAGTGRTHRSTTVRVHTEELTL